MIRVIGFCCYFIAILFNFVCFAQLPDGYYGDCEGNYIALKNGKMEFKLTYIIGSGEVRIKKRKIVLKNDFTYIGDYFTYEFTPHTDSSEYGNLYLRIVDKRDSSLMERSLLSARIRDDKYSSVPTLAMYQMVLFMLKCCFLGTSSLKKM